MYVMKYGRGFGIELNPNGIRTFKRNPDNTKEYAPFYPSTGETTSFSTGEITLYFENGILKRREYNRYGNS